MGTTDFQTAYTYSQLSFGGVADLGISKHVILLAFTYAYAPRGDFFRTGAFWEGTSGPSSDASSSDAGKSGSGGVEIKK